MLATCERFDTCDADVSIAGAMAYGCDDSKAPQQLASDSASIVKSAAIKHVEQVSLHQFNRGYQRDQYAHAFVLLGQNIASIPTCEQSCSAATGGTCSGFVANNVTLGDTNQCNLVSSVPKCAAALQRAR